MKSYPVHESGGIVWTYMGPAETMTPFRDFGTESLPADAVAANKEQIFCNWVQSMDGDLDTAHISNLHQFDAIDDVPDDGTDKPGYPSGFMSMKFWRHDPRRAIEVDDTWHGFRYAGIRTTPNGYRHVRVTAWIFPSSTIIAQIPFSTRLIFVVPSDDVTTYRYNFTTQPLANPRGLRRAPFFTYEKYPFEMLPPNGVIAPHLHPGERLPDRPVRPEGPSYSGIADFRSQDAMATETAGPVFDRTTEHLGSTDVALIRCHRQLLRAAKALAAAGGNAARPGCPRSAAAATSRRSAAPRRSSPTGEDWRRPRHRRRPSGPGGAGRGQLITLPTFAPAPWLRPRCPAGSEILGPANGPRGTS